MKMVKGYAERVGVKKKTSIGSTRKSLSLKTMNKHKRKSFKVYNRQGK